MDHEQEVVESLVIVTTWTDPTEAERQGWEVEVTVFTTKSTQVPRNISL